MVQYGSTALMWAMTCKATETVRLLLAHPGINVFLQDQVNEILLVVNRACGFAFLRKFRGTINAVIRTQKFMCILYLIYIRAKLYAFQL